MSSESSDSGLLCLFTDQIDGFGAQYLSAFVDFMRFALLSVELFQDHIWPVCFASVAFLGQFIFDARIWLTLSSTNFRVHCI